MKILLVTYYYLLLLINSSLTEFVPVKGQVELVIPCPFFCNFCLCQFIVSARVCYLLKITCKYVFSI